MELMEFTFLENLCCFIDRKTQVKGAWSQRHSRLY